MQGGFPFDWTTSCIDMKGTEISGKHLVFGSDEEKAMTKALRHCFPQSQHVLCTRHLEENVRRRPRHNIGTSDRIVQSVVSEIFGNEGLIASDDECTFGQCLISLYCNFTIWCSLSTSSDNLRAFQFADSFRILFIDSQEFLVQFNSMKFSDVGFQTLSFIMCKFFIKYCSNSGISFFALLTQFHSTQTKCTLVVANWKALKLSELVDKLHQIVKLQYKDMRHCVKGIIRWHHGLKKSKLVQLFGNPKQKTRKMNFLTKNSWSSSYKDQRRSLLAMTN
jgi:hypothetical protein